MSKRWITASLLKSIKKFVKLKYTADEDYFASFTNTNHDLTSLMCENEIERISIMVWQDGYTIKISMRSENDNP